MCLLVNFVAPSRVQLSTLSLEQEYAKFAERDSEMCVVVQESRKIIKNFPQSHILYIQFFSLTHSLSLSCRCYNNVKDDAVFFLHGRRRRRRRLFVLDITLIFNRHRYSQSAPQLVQCAYTISHIYLCCLLFFLLSRSGFDGVFVCLERLHESRVVSERLSSIVSVADWRGSGEGWGSRHVENVSYTFSTSWPITKIYDAQPQLRDCVSWDERTPTWDFAKNSNCLKMLQFCVDPRWLSATFGKMQSMSRTKAELRVEFVEILINRWKFSMENSLDTTNTCAAQHKFDVTDTRRRVRERQERRERERLRASKVFHVFLITTLHGAMLAWIFPSSLCNFSVDWGRISL